MFDLSELKLVKGYERDDKSFSFVGIKKNIEENILEFWLPHGFDDFPDNSFEDVKKIFFLIYKILRVYEIENKKKKNDRDGNLIKSNDGFTLENKYAEEEIILYSKLTLIDTILDTYDELAIFSIINIVNRTNDIDYSKIDKYMDKCVYLSNDLIYIDEMNLSKKIINYSAVDLIGMFCFVYYEIMKELDNNSFIKPEIKYLSLKFKEKYLSKDS